MLTNSLAEHIAGHASKRPNRDKHPQAKKPELLWTISRSEGLATFLEIIEPHLHFKRPLIKAFRNYVVDLANGVNAQPSLKEFQRVRIVPPSEELYLPTPRNLAGRFDANGSIGMYPIDNPNPGLRLRFGTEYTGMITALTEKYGGGFGDNDAWVLQGQDAEAFLREEKDYLRVFQARAKLALKFMEISDRMDTPRDPLNEMLKDSSDNDVDLRGIIIEGFPHRLRYLNANPI